MTKFDLKFSRAQPCEAISPFLKEIWPNVTLSFEEDMATCDFKLSGELYFPFFEGNMAKCDLD